MVEFTYYDKTCAWIYSETQYVSMESCRVAYNTAKPDLKKEMKKSSTTIT